RNMCLNHLTRYRARWRFFSEMAPEEEGEHPVDVPVESVTSAEMDDADRRAMLERVLQKLPSAQRVPLVLYHFEDMSYEEIAVKMRISLAKVKTDIHRARETLRKYLKGAAANDPGWFGAPQPPPPASNNDGSRRLSLCATGFAPEIVFNQRLL
ncbi:MAG TPA: RNA polymerase sigma factor, partial [Verrucomicrobiae bacterium]|nr:RNA polymerase sigma factor [Verrucomicrobiae bacterium]